jgi:hypothetical protein
MFALIDTEVSAAEEKQETIRRRCMLILDQCKIIGSRQRLKLQLPLLATDYFYFAQPF